MACSSHVMPDGAADACCHGPPRSAGRQCSGARSSTLSNSETNAALFSNRTTTVTHATRGTAKASARAYIPRGLRRIEGLHRKRATGRRCGAMATVSLLRMVAVYARFSGGLSCGTELGRVTWDESVCVQAFDGSGWFWVGPLPSVLRQDFPFSFAGAELQRAGGASGSIRQRHDVESGERPRVRR